MARLRANPHYRIERLAQEPFSFEVAGTYIAKGDADSLRRMHHVLSGSASEATLLSLASFETWLWLEARRYGNAHSQVTAPLVAKLLKDAIARGEVWNPILDRLTDSAYNDKPDNRADNSPWWELHSQWAVAVELARCDISHTRALEPTPEEWLAQNRDIIAKLGKNEMASLWRQFNSIELFSAAVRWGTAWSDDVLDEIAGNARYGHIIRRRTDLDAETWKKLGQYALGIIETRGCLWLDCKSALFDEDWLATFSEFAILAHAINTIGTVDWLEATSADGRKLLKGLDPNSVVCQDDWDAEEILVLASRPDIGAGALESICQKVSRELGWDGQDRHPVELIERMAYLGPAAIMMVVERMVSRREGNAVDPISIIARPEVTIDALRAIVEAACGDMQDVHCMISRLPIARQDRGLRTILEQSAWGEVLEGLLAGDATDRGSFERVLARTAHICPEVAIGILELGAYPVDFKLTPAVLAPILELAPMKLKPRALGLLAQLERDGASGIAAGTS